MGHQGSLKNKIQAIEYLDERVIRIVKEGLDKAGVDYRMLVMPDHPTPISKRTHTSTPIPYLIYDSTKRDVKKCQRYNEKEAETSGNFFAEGYRLMDHYLEIK